METNGSTIELSPREARIQKIDQEIQQLETWIDASKETVASPDSSAEDIAEANVDLETFTGALGKKHAEREMLTDAPEAEITGYIELGDDNDEESEIGGSVESDR